MIIDPFTAQGRWFRGNLHTHTTESDGGMTPEEMVGWHVTHGYDFLSLTEHRLRLDPTPYARDSLLLIPGIELHGVDHTGIRPHASKRIVVNKEISVKVTVVDQWCNVCRCGDPNRLGLPTWPSYEAETDLNLELSEETTVKSGLLREACDLAERIHLMDIED